jgi:hypothetical protein
VGEAKDGKLWRLRVGKGGRVKGGEKGGFKGRGKH